MRRKRPVVVARKSPHCALTAHEAWGLGRELSVRLDDLVRPFLVAHGLVDAIVVGLQEIDGNDQRGLKIFEFSCPSDHIAGIGRAGKEIAFLEDLVSVLVDVIAEAVQFCGLGSRIHETAKQASSAHVMEDRISGIVRCSHGLVDDDELLPVPDRHRLDG